MLKKIKLKK